jgi:hypothetical protein
LGLGAVAGRVARFGACEHGECRAGAGCFVALFEMVEGVAGAHEVFSGGVRVAERGGHEACGPFPEGSKKGVACDGLVCVAENGLQCRPIFELNQSVEERHGVLRPVGDTLLVTLSGTTLTEDEPGVIWADAAQTDDAAAGHSTPSPLNFRTHLNDPQSSR